MSEHTNKHTETHACDLIERQAAIEWVENILEEDKYYHPHAKSRNVPIDEVIDRLKRLPSAQPEVDCQKCIFRGFPGFKQFQEERTAESAQNVPKDDLISRKAAIDAAKAHWYKPDIAGAIEQLPSAQPELPKQFMSDDCISRSELYKKVCEAEKLARERVLDTPSDSPLPNKLNPAYTRYSAQLDERTQFKNMIADARSVQPEQRWIPCGERTPEQNVFHSHEYVGEWYSSEVVLVWLDKPFDFNEDNYALAYYDKDMGKENTRYGWAEMITGEEIEPVAWMPLPKPYKERREEP